jgi:hypothetical protein
MPGTPGTPGTDWGNKPWQADPENLTVFKDNARDGLPRTQLPLRQYNRRDLATILANVLNEAERQAFERGCRSARADDGNAAGTTLADTWTADGEPLPGTPDDEDDRPVPRLAALLAEPPAWETGQDR